MQTNKQQFPYFDPDTTDFSKLSVGFFRISPEVCGRIVETRNHPLNRTQRRSLSGPYQRDMEGGRFLITHQGIGFDRKGIVVDGQHRLDAASKSGEDLVIQVTTGLDPEVFHVIDKGGKRTAGDTAKMLGYANANLFAAASRLLWIHEHHGLGRMSNPDCKPTEDQIRETMDYHDGSLNASASFAAGMSRICMPSVIALCHYLFSRQNPTAAQRFFMELKDGVGLQKGMGSYTLRRALERNAAATRKMPQKTIIAYFFIAWAAYRDGRPLFKIEYNPDGTFPSIEMNGRKRRAA